MGYYQMIQGLNDWLVERAEQVVRDHALGTGDDSGEGAARNTQLSRAIEVARSSSSLRVFLNWLRYQASRRQSGGQLWATQSVTGNRPLVENLVHELGRIEQRVIADLPGSPDAEQKQATMEAVVRFLGFLRRAVIGARYLPKAPGPQGDAGAPGVGAGSALPVHGEGRG